MLQMDCLCPHYSFSILLTACSLAALHQNAGRGEDAVFKSLEQLQEASQPLYTNLFLPFSNQPNGMTCINPLCCI